MCEELGIRVRESRPWVVREHVYQHAHVRLHFRRVVRWDGRTAAGWAALRLGFRGPRIVNIGACAAAKYP